jgi:hypothetical protein
MSQVSFTKILTWLSSNPVIYSRKKSKAKIVKKYSFALIMVLNMTPLRI